MDKDLGKPPVDVKPPVKPDKPTLDPTEMLKLRDIFAAAALIGLSTNASQAMNIAVLAYATADAMLTERRRIDA